MRKLTLVTAMLLLLVAASPARAILSCADYCTSCTTSCYYWCYDDDHGTETPCMIYIQNYGGTCRQLPECQAAASPVVPACATDLPATDPRQDGQPVQSVESSEEDPMVRLHPAAPSRSSQ